jgi:biotin carboxylase
MGKKRAVLFLEPMNHVLKVVEAAHKEGLLPICVHNLPLSTRPPYGGAVELFDASIAIDSWRNIPAMEAAFEKLSAHYEIVGTYSAAEITLIWESQIRARLGLPSNGPALITDTLDKHCVRKTLQRHQLTSLACFDQEEVGRFTSWPDGLIAYFKPRNGSASAHVHRCISMEDLEHAKKAWEAQSETTLAPLKEYIHSDRGFFLEQGAIGELVSLEGLNFDGHYTVLGLTSRSVLAENPVIEMGACFPYQHPHYDRIVEKVTAIHKVLGIKHGATHTEVIVSDDGVVELVELNIRFAGADLLMLINFALGIALESQLLALGCGRPHDKLDMATGKFAAVQYFLAPEGEEIFEAIEFPEGQVVFERVIAQAGAKLSTKANQEGFIAAFIAVDDEYANLLIKVLRLRLETKVNRKALGDQRNNRVILR